jgi:hypothetical protein
MGLVETSWFLFSAEEWYSNIPREVRGYLSIGQRSATLSGARMAKAVALSLYLLSHAW